jgi:hypothetical protein
MIVTATELANKTKSILDRVVPFVARESFESLLNPF